MKNILYRVTKDQNSLTTSLYWHSIKSGISTVNCNDATKWILLTTVLVGPNDPFTFNLLLLLQFRPIGEIEEAAGMPVNQCLRRGLIT